MKSLRARKQLNESSSEKTSIMESAHCAVSSTVLDSVSSWRWLGRLALWDSETETATTTTKKDLLQGFSDSEQPVVVSQARDATERAEKVGH